MGRRLMTIILPLLFGLLFLGGGAAAAADPADKIIQQQAEHLPTDQVERYWSQLMQQYGGFFPENKVPSFMDLLTGRQGLGLSAIFKGMLRFFFHEVLVNGKLMASIIILTVFSMVLETLQSAFERKAVSKVGYSIAYMVLIVIAINSFNIAVGYAKSAISGMIHFMIAVVPLLLTLLASMGNVVSVTVMHPLIIFMINTIGTGIYYVVFPLLFFSVILHIVSSLSEKYQVTNLADLLQKTGAGLLGAFITIFIGVLSVQGATGAVTDGVTIRTAKYITGNFIPVVGKLFSEASDTVVGASLLVKNAIGLAGVVIIIFLCAFPAIKILSLALIYNVSAAVMQPLGETPIVKCLETVGKSMIYVFAALAAVGFLFFLAITIIITASNVSVMMR